MGALRRCGAALLVAALLLTAAGPPGAAGAPTAEQAVEVRWGPAQRSGRTVRATVTAVNRGRAAADLRRDLDGPAASATWLGGLTLYPGETRRGVVTLPAE